MSSISVTEAAEILGVDARQVRRLAQAGLISGRRSSAGWLLDEGSVRNRGANRPAPGRPLSPVGAWSLLKLLDEVSVEAPVEPGARRAQRAAVRLAEEGCIDRHEARRLAERLANLPDDEQAFWNLVRRRASVESYTVHPGVLGAVSNDPAVSPGGAKALAAIASLAEGSAPLLAYVDEPTKERIVQRYRAKPDPAGNLLLAVVPSEVPTVLRPTPGRVTPASVTYTDALAADDARARGLAKDWFQRARRRLAGERP